MVIRTMQKKALYDGENFFHCDQILFFRHQLRVKNRYDRKRLDRITFDKRWVHTASMIVRKVATLESSFPPLPVHGNDGLDLLGYRPDKLYFPFRTLVSSMMYYIGPTI